MIPKIPHDRHLQIGSLLFEGLDQIDLTGPFEVLFARAQLDLPPLRQVDGNGAGRAAGCG